MLGIGWAEILLIMAIAVFVIGPKDIPNVMYTLGRLFRRFQYVRFAISQQFDDILKAGDIEELRRGVNFEAPKTDEKSADEIDVGVLGPVTEEKSIKNNYNEEGGDEQQ